MVAGAVALQEIPLVVPAEDLGVVSSSRKVTPKHL